jgi:hypothetical protein
MKEVCDDDDVWRDLWRVHFGTGVDEAHPGPGGFRAAFRVNFGTVAISFGVWAVFKPKRVGVAFRPDSSGGAFVYFSSEFCAVVSSTNALVRILSSGAVEELSTDEFRAKYAEDVAADPTQLAEQLKAHDVCPLTGMKRVSGYTLQPETVAIPDHRCEGALIIRHPALPFVILLPLGCNGWLDVYPAEIDLQVSPLPSSHHVWSGGAISPMCAALLKQAPK